MKRLTPLLLALLFFASVFIALAWTTGDEFMLVKTSQTSPYNVLVYGDSVSDPGDVTLGWTVSGAIPNYNYWYFTPVTDTSVVTITAEVYSNRPTDWVVGGIDTSTGCDIDGSTSGVRGTNGSWVERTWSVACYMDTDPKSLRMWGTGGNSFHVRKIRFYADTVQRTPGG